MSNLPTLVFVPGSWHKPACYNKIIRLLQDQHGLKCVAITLPSTAGNPAATFKDDVDAARSAIAGETTSGRDVVVIAHSYGGMVGNSAIKGFARPQPDARQSSSATASTPQHHNGPSPAPAAGHVIGIILIASGFTLTGVAFMDPFLGRPPPQWRVNEETGFADIVVDPRDFFYHDLPPDEAEYWAGQLTPHSLKSLFEGREVAYAGWMDVPAWYIGTVEDRGLPVAMQRMTVGMARGMGGRVEHRELPTSHSPFLSRPEETAAIVAEAVEAFTGRSLEPGPEPAAARIANGRGGEIAIPEAKLWQPVTWYRFGLPLVFGHLLGKCVLIFGWGRRLWSWRAG